jgi:hypothetical protein
MCINLIKNGTNWAKEKILIRAYDSAFALKEEIRNKIGLRQRENWELFSMQTRGPFLTLCFKKHS